MSDLIEVEVPLGARAYSVLIGPGARHELAAVLDSALGRTPKRAVVVTQRGVGVDVEPELTAAGVRCLTVPIADGEQAKQLSEIEKLCRRFVEFGLTRDDVVVGVGGGVVTDTAGFAAAVYHRGTAVVHVATTLLCQVDAAVGGKTGVNLPEGKNLVGAFWQPAAVVCDTETLATLAPRDLRAGYGELAKYHWLGGGDLDTLPLAEQVARCVAVKADFVASDETDAGRRALLNYGHTLAHALETSGRFDLRHGEAVAVGLRYAALVARRLGRIDDAAVAEHRRVLAAYELASDLPAGSDHDDLLRLFGRDKKATDGITFVLDGPDGLEVVPGVDEATLRAALAEMTGTLSP